MPKNRKSNKNQGKIGAAVSSRLQALERNIPGRAGRTKSAQPSYVSSVATRKGEPDMIGSVLRMMLDPCHAPPVPIPDQYNGKSVLVKSVGRYSMSLDGSGNRGVIVYPNITSKVAFSGATTYSTWTFQDDSLISELTSSEYQYGRQVAMCVTIKPLMPSTSTAPEIRSWCGPHLSTTVRTAAGVGFDDKPSMSHETRVDIEAAWCAREMVNFTPYLAATAPGSSETNISGGLLSAVPALHFDLRGGTASASLVVEVTTVYEMFFAESTQYKPGVMSPTNLGVLGIVINAIHSFKWTRDGSAIQKISSYANKAYNLALKAEPIAAWAVGKAVSVAALL